MDEKAQQNQLRPGELISSVGAVSWVLLGLLAVACYSVYFTRMNFWRVRMEANETEIIRLIVERVSAGFEPAVADLLILSENPQLSAYLAHPSQAERTAMELELLRWCRRKTDYFEIQMLNDKGVEIARVNYNHGAPVVVPMDELRDVSERTYFVRTLTLDRQEVFVSPFELNVNEGRVEQPPHPMVLFSTPVFDQEGYKRGVLIFSYEGQKILDKIKAETGGSVGEIMLLNANGYWLKGPNPQDEWGFMDEKKKNRTFARSSPGAWEKIVAAEAGKFYDENGFYAFGTLSPIAAGGPVCLRQGDERDVLTIAGSIPCVEGRVLRSEQDHTNAGMEYPVTSGTPRSIWPFDSRDLYHTTGAGPSVSPARGGTSCGSGTSGETTPPSAEDGSHWPTLGWNRS